MDEVRDVAKAIDPELGDAIIRGTGAPVSTDHYSGFQMESKEVTAQDVVDFRFALNKKFGESAVPQDKFSQTTVSGSFGREILQSAILAFVFSMVLIVAYLASGSTGGTRRPPSWR